MPRTTTIEHQIINIISKKKEIKPSRLRAQANLSREFGFDTVDVVDIILELEKSFKITIPDEVPIDTVGDFINFISRQSQLNGSVRPA